MAKDGKAFRPDPKAKPHGGKPQWTPSETETAALNNASAHDLLTLIHAGGDSMNKVRRWWQSKTGGDYTAFMRAIDAWQREAGES